MENAFGDTLIVGIFKDENNENITQMKPNLISKMSDKDYADLEDSIHTLLKDIRSLRKPTNGPDEILFYKDKKLVAHYKGDDLVKTLVDPNTIRVEIEADDKAFEYDEYLLKLGKVEQEIMFPYFGHKFSNKALYLTFMLSGV